MGYKLNIRTFLFVFSLLSQFVHALINGLAFNNRRFKVQTTQISPTALYPTKPGDAYWNRPGPWDDPNLDTLLNANKKWSKRVKQTAPEFFEAIREGHAPKILWVGCSDARVPANEIIGEPPGSVFVHRNVANMVVNTDFNCMSVIQYAVDVLQVKHIIVCGHYDCGGVKAALEPVDHKSPLENWLRNIRDVYRLHQSELNAITDITQRQRRLVELNVVEQCLNIFKTAVVQRRRVDTHLRKGIDPYVQFAEPRVHAFVYEPGTGDLKRLNVDFKDYINSLQSIYDMYTITPATPKAEVKAIAESNTECIVTDDGEMDFFLKYSENSLF